MLFLYVSGKFVFGLVNTGVENTFISDWSTGGGNSCLTFSIYATGIDISSDLDIDVNVTVQLSTQRNVSYSTKMLENSR